MALKVIGSGFGRTGTRSLWEAMNILKLAPCHHMEEVFANPEQVAKWQDYAAGRPVDWTAFFANYQAQVDWPGCHIWRELSVLYPDAKILHSSRPEELWWNSFSNTINKFLRLYRDLALPPHIADMMTAAQDAIMVPTFGHGPIDKDRAIAAFRKRQADVQAAIPANRLLVFDVAEGWEPLCRFLDIEVPDVAFPRTNSRVDFWSDLGGEPA